MATKSVNYLNKIPSSVNLSQVAEQVATSVIDNAFLSAFTKFSNLTDIQLSDILDLNVKTYRSYKKSSFTNRFKLKEHILTLVALFKHGEIVFGDNIEFNHWLKKENFYFDGKAPEIFLSTISGIKFIDDRLTALEYGDNV